MLQTDGLFDGHVLCREVRFERRVHDEEASSVLADAVQQLDDGRPDAALPREAADPAGRRPGCV